MCGIQSDWLTALVLRNIINYQSIDLAMMGVNMPRFNLVLKADVISKITSAFVRLSYKSPTDEQRSAITEFVKGRARDLFVGLPTGSGKSLCFAALPVVFDELSSVVQRGRSIRSVVNCSEPPLVILIFITSLLTEYYVMLVEQKPKKIDVGNQTLSEACGRGVV